LALFRITLGVTILGALLAGVVPRLVTDLGPDPLVPAAALEDWPSRSGRVCLLTGPAGVPRLENLIPPQSALARHWAELGEQPWFNYLMFSVWFLAVLGMTLGVWTRWLTVVAWALTVSFQTRLAWLNNGSDDLYRTGLFFLIFTRAGAVWSIDAWLRARSRPVPEPVTVPAWPVRLLQIQLVLIYFFTGLAKVTTGYPSDAADWWDAVRGQDWLNGEAVYWVLNDTAVNRFPYHLVPVPLLICRLLSWATLVFELGFPVFVLFRSTRRWLLLAGVAFHLGILLHTDVGSFSLVSLCWYTLFLSGPTIAWLSGTGGRANPAGKDLLSG
jgi:hypothetical protein